VRAQGVSETTEEEEGEELSQMGYGWMALRWPSGSAMELSQTLFSAAMRSQI
jgi:hypothetical protein